MDETERRRETKRSVVLGTCGLDDKPHELKPDACVGWSPLPERLRRKFPSDRALMRRVRVCLTTTNETHESLRQVIRDLYERLRFELISHGFCEQERIKFLRRVQELENETSSRG